MTDPRIDTLTHRASWAGLTLLVGAFVVFFVLPFAGLVDRALSDDRTWDFMTSDIARDALVLSVITATITLAVAVVVGTPVAYLLARTRFPGHQLVVTLIDMPILLPPTVAGVALLTAFGRRGLLGEPLDEWFGLTVGFSTTAVVMAQVFVATPFYVRAARGGFAAIEGHYESVAHTLGASRLRAFLRVSVPMARPSILAGAALCWTRAMGELGATLIFAGNLQGETQTMPLAIIQTLESSAGLAGAVALSLLLVGVGVAAIALVWLIEPARRHLR